MSIYEQMKQGAAPPGDPNRYRFTPPAQPQTDPNRFRIAPPGGGAAAAPSPAPAPSAAPTPTPLRIGGVPAAQPAGYQTLGSGGAPAGTVPRGIVPNTRNADGDRPYPYAPQKQGGAVEHWRPPTWKEILKELGWRMLESGIQAVAYEIAYFFGHRRLGVPIYVQHP